MQQIFSNENRVICVKILINSDRRQFWQHFRFSENVILENLCTKKDYFQCDWNVKNVITFFYHHTHEALYNEETKISFCYM